MDLEGANSQRTRAFILELGKRFDFLVERQKRIILIGVDFYSIWLFFKTRK